MAGELDFDELQRATSEVAGYHLQTGSERLSLAVRGLSATAAHLVGDDVLAEQMDHERADAFERRGDLDVLANVLANWSVHLSRIGRPEEALQVIARGRSIAREADIGDQISLDAAEGLARAHRGDPAASAFIDRARQRAAGIVMFPLTRQLAEIDAAVRRLLGDREGARRIAADLAAGLEATGVHRYAEFIRREFLDEPASEA
jgi:hypothetical protein